MALIENHFVRMLNGAGIGVNQPGEHAIRVNDPGLYRRILLNGSIAIGDGYMNQDWDCDDLPQFLNYALPRLHHKVERGVGTIAFNLAYRLFDQQSREKSKRVAVRHYDLGYDDLYKPMLGGVSAYSCGYWKRGAHSLEEAQNAKHALIFEKLRLKPGMRLLDIGCGFGEFAKYCAERGVTVVGVTLSTNQAKVAKEKCAELPVRILVTDYRQLRGMYQQRYFDRIASIGMFEHVGPSHYRTFMQEAAHLLKDDGLFLLHTITGKKPGFDSWVERWIFPGGYIPSVDQIRSAFGGTPEKRLFVEVDHHAFGGENYARTLDAWRQNFEDVWPKIAPKYATIWDGLGGDFYRGWMFYLSVFGPNFRSGELDVSHFLLSKQEELRSQMAYVVR